MYKLRGAVPPSPQTHIFKKILNSRYIFKILKNKPNLVPGNYHTKENLIIDANKKYRTRNYVVQLIKIIKYL